MPTHPEPLLTQGRWQHMPTSQAPAAHRPTIVSHAPHPTPKSQQLVFVLGSLGFEMKSKTRQDSLGQLDGDGNLSSARELAALLVQHPYAVNSLTWTLDVDGMPIYAIDPRGAHAARVHERLIQILVEQMADTIERVSLAGHLTGDHVLLACGTQVPVVEPDLRGLFGWSTARLVAELTQQLGVDDAGFKPDPEPLRSTLDRLYRDHQYPGRQDWQRAVHGMLTSPYLLSDAVTKAASQGLRLSGLRASPASDGPRAGERQVVRLTLIFLPEDSKGEAQAHEPRHIDIDVSDVVPVVLANGMNEGEHDRSPICYHQQPTSRVASARPERSAAAGDSVARADGGKGVES